MGNYIIFDLEWNQASNKIKEVKEIMFEILEIGAVKVDADLNIIDTFSSLIKPQVYKTMHYMTQKIVHFNMEDLIYEDPFPYVMSRFLKWCGQDPIFCSWGPSDLTELQRNMTYYGMKPLTNGPLKFLDVQKLFSIANENGRERRSLEFAVEFLKLDIKDEFHSAFSDAKYTADIFVEIADEMLVRYYSYDTFCLPASKEEEIYDFFPTYSKYISRLFKNRQTAINDKEVRSVRCDLCNENTQRIIKWFSPNNGKYYLSLSKCQNHGFVKAKNRVKKIDGEKVYIVKTVKRIDKETADSIKLKYEKAKQIKENAEKKSEDESKNQKS